MLSFLSKLDDHIGGDTEELRHRKQEREINYKHEIEICQKAMGIAPENWTSKTFPKVSTMNLEIQEGRLY
jgi:hypothetical protein